MNGLRSIKQRWDQVRSSVSGQCQVVARHGERMEIVFQAHGPDAIHLRIDANMYGGKSAPPDRPLRPL